MEYIEKEKNIMQIHKTFSSIAQIQRLQEIAGKSDEDVFIHSEDDSVMVDAKSFIGLFALDFSKPVKIVSMDEKTLQKIERI